MTSSTVLGASNFNNTDLNATASASANLYQRTATNVLDASSSTAINIGNLITNQTQLTTYGQVDGKNPTDYYSFNLTGTSIKGNFSNITNTTNLRYQLLDSKGNVVADNQGTAAQQLAFTNMSTPAGLTTTAGQYTIKVTYAPTALQSLPQSYGFQLYSGNMFNSSYETTAQTQDSSSTYVPVDNTMTYATAAAGLYTSTQYNQINENFSSAVNVGWLSANNTALKVISQATPADNTDYYKFTFQKGSSIKLAFNNTTNTSTMRVQLYDSSGLQLLADNQGTTAQRTAYAQLTSSTGLAAQNADYVVKVSFAQNANKSVTQNYNLVLSSGSYYQSLDQTTASAQTIANAMASGTYNVYSPATALATYLTNQANGSTPDIISTLSANA